LTPTLRKAISLAKQKRTKFENRQKIDAKSDLMRSEQSASTEFAQITGEETVDWLNIVSWENRKTAINRLYRAIRKAKNMDRDSAQT
jgi:hypothetical protein